MLNPEQLPPEDRCRKCKGYGGARAGFIRWRKCPRCRGTGQDPEPLEHIPRVSPPPPKRKP